MEGFSLNRELIANILHHARPLGHNEQPENANLGFGFLYYGMVRALRPKHVLVIGSGFGFSVVCLALGLKDNVKERLTFVDGNHSYENVRFDFMETLMRSRKNTYIFLHDTNIYVREMLRHAGVKKWFNGVKRRKDLFECLNFPCSSGVAMVHVLQDDAWSYVDPE